MAGVGLVMQCVGFCLGGSTLDASLLGVIFVPDSTGNACELAIASSQTYDFIRRAHVRACNT